MKKKIKLVIFVQREKIMWPLVLFMVHDDIPYW